MRKKRELAANAYYHVVSRANRKEMIFNSSQIKEMFLEVIRRAKIKYSFSITNFCIMGNHFHMIIQPQKDQNLSRIMQWILSVFARKFNQKFNYSGHVWYDRFRSKVIKSFHQYLGTFLYIARNPVRAKIIKNPTDYDYNGITFLQRGGLDILERPPNNFLKLVWFMLNHSN